MPGSIKVGPAQEDFVGAQRRRLESALLERGKHRRVQGTGRDEGFLALVGAKKFAVHCRNRQKRRQGYQGRRKITQEVVLRR